MRWLSDATITDDATGAVDSETTQTTPSAAARSWSWREPSAMAPCVAAQERIARKLDRARRCVAISELDTGRQANSLAHRREREAAIGVTHGMAKPGIAFDAIMHVVATLYRQGDFVAEGPKDIAGPRGRAPPLLAGMLDDDD